MKILRRIYQYLKNLKIEDPFQLQVGLLILSGAIGYLVYEWIGLCIAVSLVLILDSLRKE